MTVLKEMELHDSFQKKNKGTACRSRISKHIYYGYFVFIERLLL